jgi:hypothetical protein
MIEDGEVRPEGCVCEVYTMLSETRRQQSRSSPRGTYDEA